METKKSREANLEIRRTRRLAVSTVIVVVVFVAAFFVNLPQSEDYEDEYLLAYIEEADELPPLFRPEPELPKTVDEPKPATRIVVSDNATPQEEQEVPDDAVETEETEMAVDDEKEDEKTTEPHKVTTPDDIRLPQFPGGQGELIKWLTHNLRYPKDAQNARRQGRVLAEFMVNQDGSVTDIRIVKSLTISCDREVLRVLSSMPKWIPAHENNKPTKTIVRLPVEFML